MSHTFFNSNLFVISRGPGAGKTTLLEEEGRHHCLRHPELDFQLPLHRKIEKCEGGSRAEERCKSKCDEVLSITVPLLSLAVRLHFDLNTRNPKLLTYFLLSSKQN